MKKHTPYTALFSLPLLAALLVAAHAHALTEISDSDLTEVTGEGIAFLPENAVMLFRGAGANEDASTLLTARANDTGYIRYIPVGPLSSTMTSHAVYGSYVGKADLFLYGLAISRADSNANSRLSGTDPFIISWGTATNPWLLRQETESVQDFSTGNSTAQPVSFVSLEAPLYDTSLPSTRATGADAYNLKLAYWADIFNRKSDVAENMTATDVQFDVVSSGRANRARLQAIWDGLSINGTNIRLFQTLGGAVNGSGMSTFYNRTLGMSQLLRLNSGDTSTMRASVSVVNNTRTTEGWTTTWNGTKYAASGAWPQYTDTSGVSGGAASVNCANNATHNAAGSACRIRYRTRAVIDTGSSASWILPTSIKILRLSTQECGAGNPNGCTTGSVQTALATPAIGNGTAPTFSPSEGLHLYSPNFNIPLGSLSQPVIAGVATDGRNLVLEVARIPNKAAAYNSIYTNYSNNSDVIAKNCNVHRCGADLGATQAAYQASSATHGSISIGSTSYSATTNLLTAYEGKEAIGVSFGELSSATNSTSANVYREVQNNTRTTGTGTWSSTWNYLSAGSSALFNLANYSPTTWTQTGTGAAPAAPANVTEASVTPTNNFGSAVIDGILIQHLKITTKGL